VGDFVEIPPGEFALPAAVHLTATIGSAVLPEAARVVRGASKVPRAARFFARRHMTKLQLARCAERLATMRQGERTDLLPDDKRSIEDAAEQLGTS